MNIQQAFNAAAADYDRLRRILIPCFEDFYRTAVEITALLSLADIALLS